MANWIDTLNARAAGLVEGFRGSNQTQGDTPNPTPATPRKRPAKKAAAAKKAPAKKRAR